MNVGALATQFLFWKYLFRMFRIGSLKCIWILPAFGALRGKGRGNRHPVNSCQPRLILWYVYFMARPHSRPETDQNSSQIEEAKIAHKFLGGQHACTIWRFCPKGFSTSLDPSILCLCLDSSHVHPTMKAYAKRRFKRDNSCCHSPV